MTTLLYCRSGKDIGMGHVVRCAHLARELVNQGEKTAIVSYKAEPGWTHLLRSSDASGYTLEPLEWYTEGVTSPLVSWKPDRLIVDLMVTDVPLLRRLRDKVRSLIVIVGTGWSITRQVLELADMVVWQGFSGPSPALVAETRKTTLTLLYGPHFIILGPEYQEVKPATKLGAAIYLGGGVPLSYTEKVCAALHDIGGIVVLGPQHANETFNPDGFGVSIAPPTLHGILSRSRVFVGTMGMAAYEAIRCGAYPILVSRSEDHRKTARILQYQGMGLDMGLVVEEPPEDMAEWASAIAGSSAEWKSWTIDGRGAERVAKEILCR